MNNKFFVCSSPHLRSQNTTKRIMLDVIIALMPAVLASIYFFRVRGAILLIVVTSACVLSEYVMRILLKREQTIDDLSAVVTGLILSLNLPPTLPLWMGIVGSVIAIIIIKQLFGGLGQNFMNPAMGARVILVVAYGPFMTKWIAPGPDAITTATPLGVLAEGGVVSTATYFDMFIGNIGGCLGETSALALLLGGVYLLIRKVIKWEIPVIFIGTTAFLTWLIGPNGLFTGDPLYHVLSGGLMLGAIFMATDYVTNPMTKTGQIIFAFGCGLLTAVFRLFSPMPEGVSFAIILMNILTPLIDRYTVPVSFGGAKNVE